MLKEFPEPFAKAGACVAKPYDPTDDKQESETSDEDELVDGKTLNDVKLINMKRLYMGDAPCIHDPDHLPD